MFSEKKKIFQKIFLENKFGLLCWFDLVKFINPIVNLDNIFGGPLHKIKFLYILNIQTYYLITYIRLGSEANINS